MSVTPTRWFPLFGPTPKQLKKTARKSAIMSSATETENTDEDYDETEMTEMEDLQKTSAESALKRRKHTPSSTIHSHHHYHHALPQLEGEKSFSQKVGTFKTRTLWTLVLVFSFFLILAAGHFYTSMLVLALTTLVYREVIALKRNEQKDQKLPLFFFLRWYWFILTIYGTGYSCLIPLADGFQLPRYRFLEILVSHHLILTYTFALFGLILFILSLRRFSLRYQFSQFAIMLLTCLFVVGQSVFQIANISDGLIWFFISTSTVIVNDIFAYIFGIFFGRTRLIKLSPKKTVEGFLGASVVTVIWSMALSSLLSNYQVAICSQRHIIFRPFAMWTELRCKPNHVFKPQEFELPELLYSFIGLDRVLIRPAVLHSFVIGVFAAFFAPFGGFFASALKRALRIKDFGASIPGHGGITDRFDCQILMGMFTFLYVRTFVRVRRPSIDYILRLVSYLTSEEREQLLALVPGLSG